MCSHLLPRRVRKRFARALCRCTCGNLRVKPLGNNFHGINVRRTVHYHISRRAVRRHAGSSASTAARPGRLMVQRASRRMCASCGATAQMLRRTTAAMRAAPPIRLLHGCAQTVVVLDATLAADEGAARPPVLLAACWSASTRFQRAWGTRRPSRLPAACAVAAGLPGGGRQ